VRGVSVANSQIDNPFAPNPTSTRFAGALHAVYQLALSIDHVVHGRASRLARSDPEIAISVGAGRAGSERWLVVPQLTRDTIVRVDAGTFTWAD